MHVLRPCVTMRHLLWACTGENGSHIDWFWFRFRACLGKKRLSQRDGAVISEPRNSNDLSCVDVRKMTYGTEG